LEGDLKKQAQNSLEAMRTLNGSFNSQQGKHQEEVLAYENIFQCGRQNLPGMLLAMDEHGTIIRMYPELLAIQIDKCKEIFVVTKLSSS
jgi:hypothetical protein